MPFPKNNLMLRSALFVPGNRSDVIDKALNSNADAVIIDLEDAVPLSEKEAARAITKEKIDQYKGTRIIVRINPSESGMTEADLAEIVSPNLHSIMLPKVQSGKDVTYIDLTLKILERDFNLPIGKISVVSLVESALGIENAFDIASTGLQTKRFHILAFGAADYTLDMGIDLTADGGELVVPRSRLAIACRAAGLPGPLDTPFMVDMKNEKAIEKDAKRAKSLGFGGKLCVHPVQVGICNRLFSPTADEVEFAQKVVTAFECEKKDGQGVIQVEGKMVDHPIVMRSYRIIETSKKIAAVG